MHKSVFRRHLVALLTFVFLFGIVQAQPLSKRTTDQIQALLNEKALRTPTQQKISSQLLQAYRESRGQKMAVGVDLQPINVKKTSRGLVLMDIKAKVSDPLLNRLKALGCVIQNAYPQYKSIRAEVPLNRVEQIAGMNDVIFIGFAEEAETVGAGNAILSSGEKATAPTSVVMLKNKRPMDRKEAMKQRLKKVKEQLSEYIMTLGAGATTSQGDRVHRTDDVRNTYGFQGQGIKIGVLSDSYNNLGGAATDVANGELPGVGNPLGNTTPVTVVADMTSGGSDEGRAMLQLIHDMAPKAQLYYATAFNGDPDFANNILLLRNTYGCDIIVDDIFYFNEGCFQDGIIAQAVNTVTAAGAMYFSSAGNSGNTVKGRQGVYEADFNDAAATPQIVPGAKGGSIHNFGTFASPVNGDIITTATTSRYLLKWADPLGASTNDYDLFLVSSAGTVKRSSTTTQNGTQDPYEFVSPATFATGDRLVVFKATAAASVAFHLNANRGILTLATTGQTHGHSCAANAFGVAATPAATTWGAPTPNGPYPGAFTAASQVEPFSSDGYRKMFFNADTTPITPGSFTFASGGGTVRIKPDITAADGSATTVSGFGTFYGTSAAAPHAAAIAALIKSANPSLTPAQIRTALTSTALDIETAGVDQLSGVGIIQAYQAFQSAVSLSSNPILSLASSTIAEGSFSNGNSSLDPGESGTVVFQLNNGTATAATAVSAVLSSPTPGVTIPSNTINIGTINASGSYSNTSAPFKFGLASSIACGTTVTFTLTVTYSNGGSFSPQVYTFNTTLGATTVADINATLGTTPSSGTGYTATSGTQTGRVTRTSVPSACGDSRTNPGLTATTGSRIYHAYTFNNSSASSACYTITMTTANNSLFLVVYGNSGFVPATPNINWIGDQGGSIASSTFSQTVGAGQNFTIVIHEVNVGSITTQAYTLKVSTNLCSAGPSCAPVNTYTVTGGGTYCSGGMGVKVGLNGSDVGVDYQLLIGGVPTGPLVPGTGAAITFGDQTTAGTYTVEGNNTSGVCAATAMTGNAVVAINSTSAGITSATAGASPICSTATTTLTANGVTGTNPVVTWWTGTGGTGTNLGTGASLPNRGPGTYFARVTADCGAPVEASVTVGSKVNVGITSVTAGQNPIAPATTTNLTANGVTGTNATVTWWTGSGGTGTNLGNGTTLNNVGAGTYFARVTGDCGTAQEASITITVNSITCGTVTNRLYVDANNATPGNGSAWDCAMNQLSAAIAQANSNPTITSIWVADGVYKPTTGSSRTAAMTISRGNLTILGGFAGGELNAADANPAVNESIISGDIGTPNVNTDNSYRLLNINGLPSGAAPLVIDGMVFERANANGTGTSSYGGAIFLYKSSLNTTQVQIKRSVFRNNNASDNAAAIALYGNMDLDGCKFVSNTAGSAAGAIFSFQGSPTFNKCVFTGNTAPAGAAYYGNYGYPKFTRTVFAGNNASFGGAVYQNTMSADYINCVFNANTAGSGAALYQHNNSASRILNSTFHNNSATNYGSVAVFTYGSATTAENNIFWNNTAADVASISGGSNVWANNIFNANTAVPADNGTTRRFNKRGTDPLFVNPADPDGADNHWCTADDGLRLQDCSIAGAATSACKDVNAPGCGYVCSPAMDAGDNAPVNAASLTTDLISNARISCGIVDMGAYENQNCSSVTAPSLMVNAAKVAKDDAAIVANPFSTDLQIRYNGNEPCSVSVYAASGKRMYSANNIGQGITHVNTTNWSRGMYQVILITASGKTKNFKVIRM